MILLLGNSSRTQLDSDVVQAVHRTGGVLNGCGGSGGMVRAGVVPVNLSMSANVGQVHTENRVASSDSTGSGEHGIDVQGIVQQVGNIFIDFDFGISGLNEVDHNESPLQNSHEAIFQTVDNL
nr:MAG TPA: hypothetical protein [Caudoviricetes sp.]